MQLASQVDADWVETPDSCAKRARFFAREAYAVLEREKVHEADAVVAMTGMDELNVILSMYANSVKLTLTSLTCDLIYGSTTSGVQIAQLDGAPNENVDFETIENVAVNASTHIFRITASAVYGGKTYTLSKDVTFCAVSAGQSVQGEQGIQGLTGPQGPTGATGPQGRAGVANVAFGTSSNPSASEVPEGSV